MRSEGADDMLLIVYKAECFELCAVERVQQHRQELVSACLG